MKNLTYHLDEIKRQRAEYNRSEINDTLTEEHYHRIVHGFREERHKRYPNWDDAKDYSSDDDFHFYITCCC